MISKKKNSSTLIMGVVIALMGAAWLWISPLAETGFNLNNWWAFGMLFPIFYLGKLAIDVRSDGKSIMGYVTAIVCIIAVMLVFFGVFSWSNFGPIGMLAAGIGFIADSF